MRNPMIVFLTASLIGSIEPGKEVGQVAGKIECRERLGGMLRYYYRDAA